MVSIPVVCESDEFRAFLSRDSPFAATDQAAASKRNPGFSAGKDLVRTVYRSVAQSVDDMLFGPSMLDIMILRLTHHAAEFVGIVGSAVNDEDLVAQALKASGKSTSEDTLLQLSGDLKPLEGETSTSIFSAPICDLVLAIFELNKQNNWLRRQAIVIILQQVLGGTIERLAILSSNDFVKIMSFYSKIRETAKSLLEESRLMMMIDFLRDNLWPNGVLKPPTASRSIEERVRTRDEANRKLSSLLPGTFSAYRRANMSSCLPRIGCKHTRKIKRTKRCQEDFCCPPKSSFESTHCIRYH
jgi:sorting nexin-25